MTVMLSSAVKNASLSNAMFFPSIFRAA